MTVNFNTNPVDQHGNPYSETLLVLVLNALAAPEQGAAFERNMDKRDVSKKIQASPEAAELNNTEQKIVIENIDRLYPTWTIQDAVRQLFKPKD